MHFLRIVQVYLDKTSDLFCNIKHEIFISRNLSFDTTEEGLHEHFETYGKLKYAKVVINPFTEHSKGSVTCISITVLHVGACLQASIHINVKLTNHAFIFGTDITWCDLFTSDDSLLSSFCDVILGSLFPRYACISLLINSS